MGNLEDSSIRVRREGNNAMSNVSNNSNNTQHTHKVTSVGGGSPNITHSGTLKSNEVTLVNSIGTRQGVMSGTQWRTETLHTMGSGKIFIRGPANLGRLHLLPEATPLVQV